MGMFKVYVGNLDRKATADDVRTLFVAFPDVEDIALATDKEGSSRCFAIVMFRDKQRGQLAIEVLKGKKMHGRELVINEVQKKPKGGAAEKPAPRGPFGPRGPGGMGRGPGGPRGLGGSSRGPGGPRGLGGGPERPAGRPQAASAMTRIVVMRSGSRTGSPRLILSTFSIPPVTVPQTVYLRSRKVASSKPFSVGHAGGLK